jgi:hypothetical protein
VSALANTTFLPPITAPTHSPSMSMEESISLEETNKIRISLGLKPLTDDKAPSNDKDQEAEQNYANRKKQDEDNRKKGLVYIHIYELALMACFTGR